MDKSTNLNSLFKDNDNGKLVLPNFQRDFEWKVDEQKKLLSSVLTMLPIGSLLILEGEKGAFATKRLCFYGEVSKQKDECLYLLDGQQRVSTLRSIFSDLFGDRSAWKKNFDLLYNGLKQRWFLNLKKGNLEDVFGYENLKFDSSVKYEPGQIIDFVEAKKIMKKNKNDWYHPSFCKDKDGNQLNGNKLKNEIAKRASEEGLIPLYDIYNSLNSNPKSLLEYTLEKIANERVAKLKAEVGDGEKTLIEILSHVLPELEDNDESDMEEQINMAWFNLAATWKKEMLDFLQGILKMDIHVIQLPADEVGRATAIYESINKGGLSLSTYDLIVAKAARISGERSLTQRITKLLAEKIDLSEALVENLELDVPKTWSSEVMLTVESNKLANKIRDQYLDLLSIFSFTEYGNVSELKPDLIKKNKILELDHNQINENTEVTINSLVRAYAFLQFRCGKTTINDLNYNLMILPLAYLLKDNQVWLSKAKLGKLEYWYWSSLFGGSYRENQNFRCIDDIKKLYQWVHGSDNEFEPRFDKILEVDGYSTLTVLLLKDADNDVPKAMYNGILEYVLSNQPRDFVPGKEILLNSWDIAISKEIEFKDGETRPIKTEDHHIYPLGADTKIGESSKEIRKNKKHILNSPLNITKISEYANGLIKDKNPQKYFEFISDVAQWKHCLSPGDWVRQLSETDESYYERLLTIRFNKLKEKIKVELAALKQLRD